MSPTGSVSTRDRWPRLLPGERHVLFYRHWSCVRSGLIATSRLAAKRSDSVRWRVRTTLSTSGPGLRPCSHTPPSDSITSSETRLSSTSSADSSSSRSGRRSSRSSSSCPARWQASDDRNPDGSASVAVYRSDFRPERRHWPVERHLRRVEVGVDSRPDEDDRPTLLPVEHLRVAQSDGGRVLGGNRSLAHLIGLIIGLAYGQRVKGRQRVPSKLSAVAAARRWAAARVRRRPNDGPSSPRVRSRPVALADEMEALQRDIAAAARFEDAMTFCPRRSRAPEMHRTSTRRH